jgi:hypothetical protein
MSERIALVILGILLVSFLLERLPPAAIAISGAAAFLALGYVTEEARSARSPTAPP